MINAAPTEVVVATNPEVSSTAEMESVPASLNIYERSEGEEEVVLSGNLSSGAGGNERCFDTLDEPVRVTLLKDVKAVALKFRYVLYPRGEETKRNLLRDWDLWGPLMLCTLMASILRTRNESNEFAQVFVIVWIGSLVVTLNTKLLKGRISFWQSVCVLGYCLFPLVGALLFTRILPIFISNHTVLLYFSALLVIIGFAWSFYASAIFLGDSSPPNRKGLALYPIFLFYSVISWMVISDTSA